MGNITNNIIYCLKCPFTDSIHYIGKSTHGLLRPMQHLTKSHSAKVREWVEDIGVLGYSPKVEVLESNIVDLQELGEKEKYWIAKSISKGDRLLNISSVTYSKIINSNIAKIGSVNTDTPFTVMKEVALLSRRIRKQHKLNQVEFAQKMGCGIRWIKKVESGRDNSVMLDVIENLLMKVGCKLTIERIR